MESMSEACEDRDGRAEGATTLQPVILRLTLNHDAAAFAAARPTLALSTYYVCLLLQDLYKSCARGGGVKRGDVCYGMLRAAACVDESDHHALMYVWHGQTVREDRVGEASARRP